MFTQQIFRGPTSELKGLNPISSKMSELSINCCDADCLVQLPSAHPTDIDPHDVTGCHQDRVIPYTLAYVDENGALHERREHGGNSSELGRSIHQCNHKELNRDINVRVKANNFLPKSSRVHPTWKALMAGLNIHFIMLVKSNI
jgi:hypothetical protein